MSEKPKWDDRGVYFVKIRRDGTILLPNGLGWQSGDMLELKGYGFAGRVILSHLTNESFMRMKAAEADKQEEAQK